jgi:hypothetical protein
MLSWFKNLFKSKPVEKRLIDDYEYNSLRKEKEDELNRILDKISEKGMKSLTKQEQQFLKNKNK